MLCFLWTHKRDLEIRKEIIKELEKMKTPMPVVVVSESSYTLVMRMITGHAAAAPIPLGRIPYVPD